MTIDSPAADPVRILLLPGWQDSGPTHWQSRWEASHGDLRVTQGDWEWPRRGDWMARLEEVVLAQPASAAIVLAAHSLGCQLVAAWAAHSRHTARIRGALLVAPPDVERANWRPIVRERLPFPALAVLSSDDPYCAADRAAALVADWGVRSVDAGPRGHLNGESGLGDWPAGRAWLHALAAPPAPRHDA